MQPIIVRKPYYRSRIDEISSPDVVSVFENLLDAGRLEPREQFSMQSNQWLLWFFMQRPHQQLNAKNFLRCSALMAPIGKLRATEIFVFCAEVVSNRERGGSLDTYEQTKLFTFLRKFFMLKSGRRRH